LVSIHLITESASLGNENEAILIISRPSVQDFFIPRLLNLPQRPNAPLLPLVHGLGTQLLAAESTTSLTPQHGTIQIG
jgi:hypothetical protein